LHPSQESTMTSKKTYIRGTLKLVIDTADDATPAMVYAKNEKLSSSYDCATSEGMVDDEYELSKAEIDWLESYRDKVEEAFQIARKDNPEYN
jgi:hypothetical protein